MVQIFKNHMKFIKLIKKRPIVSTGVVIIVVVIIAMIAFGGGNGAEQTMTIERADFVNEISISGKVIAAQSAELGFDQSGRIATINAKVGDNVRAGSTIASIENGSARADVAQKQATLEKEQAKLASLQKGTRPEELAIYEQDYVDASSALVIAMRNAYLQIEDSIVGKADTLFDNGNTVNPQIDIRTQSYNEKRSIERDRLFLSEKMEAWKKALSSLTTTPTSESIRSARTIGNETILLTKTFFDKLASITDDLSTGNSGLSQTEIDTYRAIVNSASQQAATAASAEQASYATWASANNSLLLEKSGSTSEDITAQAAQVKSAEADLVAAQAQLRKTLITAPFDGIITKIDLKIGEITSPNTSEISIMGAGIFEVESYIPEINIARIKISDPAVITLDAYGSSVVFPATVVAIDPAETIRDGVSTYKTTLRFSNNDPRIKSGMTANIRVTTESKPDVITIPQSVITETDGKKTVQVKIGDTISTVEVMTGSTSALGQTEIVSGLNEGDVIVLPPLKVNP